MEKIDTGGGFTLAELLIVVAIIAVLVAIAIPMFTGSLEKSREAVHRSNATTLKSLAIQELLTNPGSHTDVLASASMWKVTGSYDFDSEKFLSAVKIESATAFADIAVSAPGQDLSGKAIGKVPTTGQVQYTVYFNQTDFSGMFSGS